MSQKVRQFGLPSRTWLARVILAIVLAMSFAIPQFSRAATCKTIAECNAQRNTLNTQLAERRAAQEAARVRARELQRIVSDLSAQINATQVRINATQAQINQLRDQITALEEQISQKEIELALQKENQREAIRLIYESGGGGTIELLIGHETLADAVNTTEYLDALEEKVEETIDTIKELKKVLNEQRLDLEGKRAVQEELKRTLEAQRAQISEQRALQQQALNDVNTNLADLNRQVNDLNKEIRAVDGSISAFLRSSYANATGSMVVVNNGTHYYQWAEPWGSTLIYEDTMTESGCLITAITMVAKMQGKNVGNPGDVLAALKDNGGLFYDLVSWGSGLSASTGGLVWTRHYGVDWSAINSELSFGRPVIVQMGGWHWVAVTGYNAAGGTYSVNDPYFSNRSYPTSAVTGYVTVR